LSWQDNSNNEDGFEIERSLNGTNFELLTTTNSNITNYSDTNVFIFNIIITSAPLIQLVIQVPGQISSVQNFSNPVWSTLAAVERYSLALTTNGTLWAWGYSSSYSFSNTQIMVYIPLTPASPAGGQPLPYGERRKVRGTIKNHVRFSIRTVI
jgi:hypothetical protein